MIPGWSVLATKPRRIGREEEMEGLLEEESQALFQTTAADSLSKNRSVNVFGTETVEPAVLKNVVS